MSGFFRRVRVFRAWLLAAAAWLTCVCAGAAALPGDTAADRLQASRPAEWSASYQATAHAWGVESPDNSLWVWLPPPFFGLVTAAIVFVALALALRMRRRVKETMRELRAQAKELDAMLRAVPDLMFKFDANGKYLQVLATRPDLLVASRADLLGKHVVEVMPPEAASVVIRCIAKALESGYTSGEQICLNLPDGPHWFELSAARMSTSGGEAPAVVMLSHEISQRVKDHAEIQRLADFDHLTGLPNRALLRRLYEQVAARAARQNQHLAMVFLDIDHFKNVNDSLGHDVGDQLLVQVARRLRAGLRDTDIVCRVGGDEFVLVLDDATVDVAARLTRRLQHLLHEPFDLGPYQSGVTASMGIAMYPDDGVELEVLLRDADTAMYQAKNDGRNAIRFFTAVMQARSERWLQLSAALDRAIEHDELVVMYQPIVRLATGRVEGAEALLRWRHPVLGAISPAEFIPVAESAGQIRVIGTWVLRQACTQAAGWEFARRGWVMSVNVSFIQLRSKDFVALVGGVLNATGLPGRCLELELTESVAMGDVATVKETAGQLQSLGVRIAIDDFGTGYSSMAYLRRLEFNKLKIDQSFVRNIGRDATDESIVTAIITLAHSLGMESQAEGVETSLQRDFLLRRGCDFLQGWLVSKAKAPADWGQWLAWPEHGAEDQSTHPS